MPIFARAAGTKLPGLGKYGDQRSLAQEGRLAAHVGPGDQPQPVVRAERQIVGDEALAASRSAASTTGWRPPSISRQVGR